MPYMHKVKHMTHMVELLHPILGSSDGAAKSKSASHVVLQFFGTTRIAVFDSSQLYPVGNLFLLLATRVLSSPLVRRYADQEER
jgi:hypothetical protein